MLKHRTTPEAYQLLHEGAVALAEMESVGIRVDKSYVERTIEESEQRISDLAKKIRSDPIYPKWRKRFGEKTNIGSPEQLAELVFKVEGYESKVKTASGKDAASKKALEHVDLPFVKDYFQMQKLRKLKSTYLEGLLRETVQHDDGDWYVHPFFHLNTVVTFRSSSSLINIQNQYKRDPEFSRIMRRAFIPRRGRQWVELDYGSAEVKMAANYTLDPVAIKECLDPKADPHRDTAARLFLLKPEEVSKDVRYAAKSFFVFAQFYGDYYVQCAKNLWHNIQKLTVKDSEVTIPEHLASKGVTELGACDPKERPQRGTFEKVVQDVEKWYWEEKYKVHYEWKKKWYEGYLRDGGIITKLGFAINGVFSRNDIISYPIQATSFHQLLWSIIRITRAQRRYKFKSRITAEIHDCIDSDVCPRERDDYINLCRDIMTKDIVKAWPWLVVPPVCEPECCPVDHSWIDLTALKEENDRWVPADIDKWTARFGSWETAS